MVHLCRCKLLDPSELITMCHDVCSGMQYLESEGWIHGDLACRNVLVNANQVCQVADFGLTVYQGLDIENNGRDESGKVTRTPSLKEKKTLYVKCITPYAARWCPPEVIGIDHDGMAKRHFSHKSDVWAFGVTMYEIFTAAETPYSRVTDPLYTSKGLMRYSDVKRYVMDGLRLPRPVEIDISFFARNILPCWDAKPSQRPTFCQLEAVIRGFLPK